MSNQICVGIDISKASFVACVCQRSSDYSLHFSSTKEFKNGKTGFNQLLRWVRSTKQASGSELCFLMEATGVYHQALAHHLFKIKQRVHVVLPNTSKHFFASLNLKTKTDAVDAKVLSRFGVERQHRPWSPPNPVMAELRAYTRYILQLKQQKTALNNIQKSKECAVQIPKAILRSNRSLVATIDKRIEYCRSQIRNILSQHPELQQRVERLCTIKGVGLMTIVTILAETDGFHSFTSVKQVVSYAGYDVVQNESGTSVHGKSRISKKGNNYIREALYFPAMVAARHNHQQKAFYLRVVQNKASKMIANVAVQRKLLSLIFSLWKSGETYDPKKKTASNKKIEAALDLSPKPESFNIHKVNN